LLSVLANNYEKLKNVDKLILGNEIVLIKVSNVLFSVFISMFHILNEISSFSLDIII